MKQTLIAITLALLTGCSPVKKRLFSAPLHIDHINDGGAFRGIVDARYYRDGDTLHVDVKEWVIRFGCNDQPGRDLDAIYFVLGDHKKGKYWATDITSNRHEMNRYIRRDNDIVLENLTFTLPLHKHQDLHEAWLVASYENTASGTTGMNYGHPENYLFSERPIEFAAKRNK